MSPASRTPTDGDGTWPPPGVKPIGTHGGRSGPPPSPSHPGPPGRRVGVERRGSSRPNRGARAAIRPRGEGHPLGAMAEIERALRLRDALVVVDGYNLSRAAWSRLTPEEERRRTVALLEELRARFVVEVTVVFDGAAGSVAPAASRSIRVRFSSDGASADDLIGELVAAAARSRSVLVVSSDREVAQQAWQAGASTIDAQTFLAVAGR